MSEFLPVPGRLGAKICVDPSTRLSAASVIPVFHSWIGGQAVAEVLIDVVDYSHVLEGPALMLVALEADYVIDEGDGKTGIRYIRNRAGKRLRQRALADIANACFAIAFIYHIVSLQRNQHKRRPFKDMAVVNHINQHLIDGLSANPAVKYRYN